MKSCARIQSLFLSLTVAAGFSACSALDAAPESPGPDGTLAEPLDYHRDHAFLGDALEDRHRPPGRGASQLGHQDAVRQAWLTPRSR